MEQVQAHVCDASGMATSMAPQLGAPHRGRVLLVGEPCRGRARLARALARSGYQPLCVDDGAAALIQLRRRAFAAVLLSDDLPGIRGKALLPGIRVAWPELPVIFVRRPDDGAGSSVALASGANTCLVAPVRASEVLRALGAAGRLPGGAGRRPGGD